MKIKTKNPTDKQRTEHLIVLASSVGDLGLWLGGLSDESAPPHLRPWAQPSPKNKMAGTSGPDERPWEIGWALPYRQGEQPSGSRAGARAPASNASMLGGVRGASRRGSPRTPWGASVWPGNVSGRPRKSWTKWPGRRKSGLPQAAASASEPR